MSAILTTARQELRELEGRIRELEREAARARKVIMMYNGSAPTVQSRSRLQFAPSPPMDVRLEAFRRIFDAEPERGFRNQDFVKSLELRPQAVKTTLERLQRDGVVYPSHVPGRRGSGPAIWRLVRHRGASA